MATKKNVKKTDTFKLIKEWFDSYIADKNAPFSLTLKKVKGLCGAENDEIATFDDIKARWTQTVKKEDGKYFVSYEDKASHLLFELSAELYKDVAALDYVVTVKNTSNVESSPVIAGFSSIDAAYPLKAKEGYTVENANGSIARADDFQMKTCTLDKTFNVRNPHGRSTDEFWPFFAVDSETEGFLFSVAWSGSWDVTITDLDKEAVGVKVDLLDFNSFLLPGESIRSQRIVILANEGDNEYGHNLFRKMVVSHYSPHCRDGKPFTPPIAINFWGGRNTAFISKVAKAYADADIKADTVWLDAAWYGNYPFMGEDRSIGWNDNSGGSWEKQLGVWDVNKNLYPGGMRGLANYIHENTPYKMMLWWMMEDGRSLPYSNHYDLGNGAKGYAEMDVLNNQTFGKDSYYREFYQEEFGRRVLKLSDEKVFKKVINYFRYMFSCENIDWMRIDYWARPAKSWRVNDVDDATELVGEEFSAYRSGMTENKYIVNLYRFFDTMYAEFPGWLLDNCASGGRRLDLEMALRGIPLWRTDYNNSTRPDYNVANQAQTQYLSRWLPFTGIGVPRPTEDKYYERSFYCAAPCIGGNKLDAEGLKKLKALVDEYVMIRPYWSGNYYQLEPVSLDMGAWQAYELFREDLDEGVVICAIREETTFSLKKDRLVNVFKPKGLNPKGFYRIHDIDDELCRFDNVVKGSDLMKNGLIFRGKKASVHTYTIKHTDDIPAKYLMSKKKKTDENV